MPAKITSFYKRPDADAVFEEDRDTVSPRGEKACCVCNSNNSICVAEQGFTYNLTSAFAQTAAYFYT